MKQLLLLTALICAANISFSQIKEEDNLKRIDWLLGTWKRTGDILTVTISGDGRSMDFIFKRP